MSIDPQIAEALATAYANVAKQQLEGGDLQGAAASCESALELAPASPALLVLLGDVLLTCGQREAATTVFERSLQAVPDDPAILTRLAYLYEPRDIDRAVALHRRAVELAPNWYAVHTNLAGALFLAGDNAAGMAASRATLALAPEYEDAHLGLGESLLRAGRLPEGWLEWRWRWTVPALTRPTPFRNIIPYWDGATFEAKRLLVGRDQGLGDAIWSMRYLPLVKARGGTVIYQSPPELLEVARSAQGVDELLSDDVPIDSGAYDLYAPALNFPLIFNTSMETIPAPLRYLAAPRGHVQRWRERLGLDPHRLNVGIVWSGNPTQSLNAVRSCRLADFHSLVNIEGVKLYSLQRDGSAALRDLSLPIVDVGAGIVTLADTAAILDLLDLLITIDSAPAHLAGALGRPVWVLLSRRSHWMYHLDRDDSPWYPTMRLFRQSRAYAWEPVFERLALEIAAVAARRS